MNILWNRSQNHTQKLLKVKTRFHGDCVLEMSPCTLFPDPPKTTGQSDSLEKYNSAHGVHLLGGTSSLRGHQGLEINQLKSQRAGQNSPKWSTCQALSHWPP